MREVRFGDSTMSFPSDELGPLVDSSDLLDDVVALRARLDRDGYLYLRGLVPRERVLRARAAILGYLADRDGLEPGTAVLDGVMGRSGAFVPLMGRRPITHHPDVDGVLDAPELARLVERLWGEPARRFDHRWLRAVPHGEATGVHLDRVYMGRGSERLMTVWVPLGDLRLEDGSLCVCPGSHRDERFARVRATYGEMDVDRDLVEGWLTTDPSEIVSEFGGRWLTGDVEAGDVVTFGSRLLHASTTNVTDRWRISCDVRLQPVTDPVDERWVGEEPIGHGPDTFDPDVITPMSVARRTWGI